MMRSTAGFTLIEVLLVAALVVILGAIAIPHFSAMRARGYDSQVVSTVRHVATSEEAYYTTHQRYTDSLGDLEGLVLGEVAISLASGNSGDLASSFRVHGVGTNALHTYAWVSDPASGDPHLTEN